MSRTSFVGQVSNLPETAEQVENVPHDLSRMLAAVLGAALLFVGGIVHGTLTHRWQTAKKTDGPESRVHLVPKTIGDWDSQDSKIRNAERQVSGLTRTYTNRRTGAAVTVVLMCGPTGPIAVHPPTACYQGAGYQQSGVTRETVIDLSNDGGARHVFAIADFDQSTRPEQTQPRIYWAWSTHGTWSVPDSPRLAFAGNPVLFKLSVTCERPLGSQKSQAAPIDDFLRLLLVEIQREVFGSSPPPRLSGWFPRSAATACNAQKPLRDSVERPTAWLRPVAAERGNHWGKPSGGMFVRGGSFA